MRHVKAHRTEKEKNAMTHVKKIGMEGHAKAKTHELVREGADVDVGHVAAGKVLTIQQLRNSIVFVQE